MKRFALLLPILLFALFSCNQKPENKTSLTDEQLELLNKPLTIDTFSAFSPELVGCLCYVSLDSADFAKQSFIYMDDQSKIGFMKINGKMVKFALGASTKIDSNTFEYSGKSPEYQITVRRTEGAAKGSELWESTGSIKITDKANRSVIKSFVGECGC